MPNSLRCKIKHLCHNGTLTERERDRILKALEQEPKWIPVSERLPEEETDVLVCNANGDIEISSGSYSTEMKNEYIWYTSGWRFGKVIAWMPLPKPYKESEGNEDIENMLEHLWNDVADEESEEEVCSSSFIQLKQDVLNNKQLWRKLREIEDEDSD